MAIYPNYSPFIYPQQMYQQQNIPQQITQQIPQISQQPTQQQTPSFICRPVASEQEALATPTDFNGSTLVLTDFANGKIYVKALNYQDGSAIFHRFVLDAPKPVVAQQADTGYATVDDLKQLRIEFEERLDKLTAKATKKAKVETE